MIRVLARALLVVLLAAVGVEAQPTVTAVNVPTLKITAGSRAPVTLQGTDLDQLLTASVLKGTAPATGVTAELGAAAGKTSRVVTVIAQTTAAPGRDYKLSVSNAKATLTPPVTIEIVAPATATAPTALKPPSLPPAPVPPPADKPTTSTATAPTALKPPSLPPVPAPPPVDKPTTSTVPESKAMVTAPSVAKPSLAAPAPTAALKSPVLSTTIARPLIVTPSVSRVEPPLVQLNPGGKATVMLYGQALERVQAIAVTPARGTITTQLGAAASTMRSLVLVAGPTTLPGRYQLTAQAGTTSFVLAAPLDVVARPAIAPVLQRLDRSPDGSGYTLVGANFGSDRSRVAVYEGGARVSDFAVVSVAPNQITVRSRPTGQIAHRVEVGGVASASLSINHPGPTIGSVGVTGAELARILASPKAAGVTSPPVAGRVATPGLAARPGLSAAAPGAPAGSPRPPSPPSPSVAARPGGSPSAAAGPARPQTPASRGFTPRTAMTPELTMTGLGPQVGLGQ